MERAFIKPPATIEESTAALSRVVAEFIGADGINALLMRHVDGMSEGEIARVVGVSRQVVSKKISVARGKLRRVGLLPPAWDTSKQ